MFLNRLTRAIVSGLRQVLHLLVSRMKKISGGSSCNLITNKKILKMMENEVGPIFILFRFVLPLLLWWNGTSTDLRDMAVVYLVCRFFFLLLVFCGWNGRAGNNSRKSSFSSSCFFVFFFIFYSLLSVKRLVASRETLPEQQQQKQTPNRQFWAKVYRDGN